MDFTNKIPIYLQIVELFFQQILEDRWRVGERIPSVREAASEMQVNPNTMMRVYTHLQQSEIIFNRRGIGYFVAESAKDNIIREKRSDFIENELPLFMKNIKMLGLSLDDIKMLYDEKINSR